MATPTPWQVAGGGKKVCHSSYVTVKVFSRGTEPWPYYQPPALVEPVGGSPDSGGGGYGDVNGSSGGGGPGGNTGGSGESSGGSGGSGACPCGNTDGAGGAAPGP